MGAKNRLINTDTLETEPMGAEPTAINFRQTRRAAVGFQSRISVEQRARDAR